jgi:hypothetical protein
MRLFNYDILTNKIEAFFLFTRLFFQCIIHVRLQKKHPITFRQYCYDLYYTYIDQTVH